jgi:hypothetical protein
MRQILKSLERWVQGLSFGTHMLKVITRYLRFCFSYLVLPTNRLTRCCPIYSQIGFC